MTTRRKRTREESRINEAMSVPEPSTRKGQTNAKEPGSVRKRVKLEPLAEPGTIVLQPRYCLQRHYADLGKCLACVVGTTHCLWCAWLIFFSF
jgi:hypothetical protein